MMNEREESGPPTVARKPANAAARADGELAERKSGAEGNAGQDGMDRTPSRAPMFHGLERVRQAARTRKKEKFTALMHHVDVDLLRSAYSWLKRDAAAGVDGVTWDEYGGDLEGNLVDLHARIHRGAYRAKPSRRVYVPKPDGRQRPLGIAALEDKIVQRAVVPFDKLRGAERDLRGRSPRVLVRVPAGAQPARCAALRQAQGRSRSGSAARK